MPAPTPKRAKWRRGAASLATSKTNDARLTAGRIVWQARRDRIRASEGVLLQWGDFELRERALNVDTALEKAWSGD
jgi:hypothetical protein